MNTLHSIPRTSPPDSENHLVGLFAAALLVLIITLLWRHDADPLAVGEKEAIALTQSEVLYGIKLITLGLTADGTMLDFRYRVTDPIKATLLAQLDDRAYILTDQQIRLDLPPLFSAWPIAASANLPRAGQTFNVAVSNPDRLFERGDRITLVLGKFKAGLHLH